MIEEGRSAPDFTLPQDGGDPVTLSEMRGQPVVVYFYPRDDTSGCTKEALAFTEARDAFDDAGIRILGISKDSVATHAKFRQKHGLGITLLSDSETDICERYGVWAKKSMYGKTYYGIERSTFLIDGDGTLRRIWRKVKVPGHADAVLDAARSL